MPWSFRPVCGFQMVIMVSREKLASWHPRMMHAIYGQRTNLSLHRHISSFKLQSTILFLDNFGGHYFLISKLMVTVQPIQTSQLIWILIN